MQFVEDVCGPAAQEAVRSLQDGKILLLENVRYMAEEQTLFELKLKLTHEQQAQTVVVRKLAPLADLYICDAFAAAHRDQPSLCGFEQVLPSAMGRLFEKEFVNGPMGVFEQETTELGTKAVWLALGAAKAYTVVGGGDSITATTKYGQTDQIDYICTGGGALIRFLTGEELPVVKALRHGATVEEKK